jgi:C_GCAxxG_C_C family probable redox protein
MLNEGFLFIIFCFAMKKIDVNERTEKARALFLSGYNCTQAVFVAYCDVFDMKSEFAAKICAPFGGGMGRLREVCGAVSGMFFIAGQIEPAHDISDRTAKKRNYALVQELAEQFRKEHGSIVCRELLDLSCGKDDPDPSERTPAYYKKRPCVKYIASAARIVGNRMTISGDGQT